MRSADVSGTATILPWRQAATQGVYTTGQVARLFGRETREVAQWLRGDPPLIESDYAPVAGRRALSFEGLIEARLISGLLNQNVPLATLRAVSARLRQAGHRHPFAEDRAVISDGFRILEVDEAGRLINLLNETYAHPELMRPALVGRVVWRGGVPAMYQPDPEKLPAIRLDPKVAFGRPVVVDSGRVVTTERLAQAALDEGVDAAAEWFCIDPSVVEQAASFEARLAA